MHGSLSLPTLMLRSIFSGFYCKLQSSVGLMLRLFIWFICQKLLPTSCWSTIKVLQEVTSLNNWQHV